MVLATKVAAGTLTTKVVEAMTVHLKSINLIVFQISRTIIMVEDPPLAVTPKRIAS